jgi:hypothetical protein
MTTDLSRLLLVATVAAMVGLGVKSAEARGKRTRKSSRRIETLADALKGDAKDEYDRAAMIFRAGDFAGALRRYQHAFELQSDPRLLWNMAVCEKQLRHYAKVLPLVAAFLEKAAPLVGVDEKKTAVEFQQAVRALVGEITFTCADPETAVLVDEERIEFACTQPIALDAGDHRLRATRSGFKELISTINVPNGGARTITIVLDPEPKEGRLTVSAEAGDVIAIDGNGVGQKTWSGPLGAGKHTLAVSAAGKIDHREAIEIREGEDRTIQVALEPEQSSVPLWLIIGGATIVIAGAAVGGYFLLRPGAAAPIPGTLGTHVLP